MHVSTDRRWLYRLSCFQLERYTTSCPCSSLQFMTVRSSVCPSCSLQAMTVRSSVCPSCSLQAMTARSSVCPSCSLQAMTARSSVCSCHTGSNSRESCDVALFCLQVHLHSLMFAETRRIKEARFSLHFEWMCVSMAVRKSDLQTRRVICMWPQVRSSGHENSTTAHS